MVECGLQKRNQVLCLLLSYLSWELHWNLNPLLNLCDQRMNMHSRRLRIHPLLVGILCSWMRKTKFQSTKVYPTDSAH
jgi:hypothetical protein